MAEKEQELQVTDEEQKIIREISFLLKQRNVDAAIELVRKIVSESKNGELVRQYAGLLQKLEHPQRPAAPAKEPEQPFQVKVEKPKVTFKDVIGMRKLKQQLSKEMILMIKNRHSYVKHHLKPSGILLYGPPGTGKSFISEAMAGEFKANIIKPDLATLFSQWVGETEKNIKKMVDLGKQNQPCVIFIDEVDSKIRNRANIEARGESAVNLGSTTQFLETMQEAHNDVNNQVIFCAATNRLWDVDSAARRPGRFGTHIYVPPPTLKDRIILFVHYLKSVDKRQISAFGYLRLALATAGYSPAELEDICIKVKKEMLFRNYNKDVNAYYEKVFTRSEYLKAKSEGRLPAKPQEKVTTQDVINVINRDFKDSSLDAWYIDSLKALVGYDEDVSEKKKGLFLTKTIKKKVRHQGLMTKSEQKVYKAMIKDIKKANSRRWYTSLVRHVARVA